METGQNVQSLQLLVHQPLTLSPQPSQLPQFPLQPMQDFMRQPDQYLISQLPFPQTAHLPNAQVGQDFLIQEGFVMSDGDVNSILNDKLSGLSLENGALGSLVK